MSMASNGDDDFAILVCSSPNSIEDDCERREILISADDILSWDLPTILSFQTVKVQAHRDRLVQQSSYFHCLLSGSFSESHRDCISILWNLPSFIGVLKCIYGSPFDVTPSNFLMLFESALYFGVETLLIKCKSWLLEASTLTVPGTLQLQVDDLIYIWNFGLQHANDFVPDLCASYLARNFMWAMSSEFFQTVPYNLLLTSIKHPHLTVDSEVHLSDAVLVWLKANLKANEGGCKELLDQIRISLLPLWFAAGTRRSTHFSDLAKESIASIFRSLQVPASVSCDVLGVGDLQHFRIRLNKYSEAVNFSGCPQITSIIILLAVLPYSYDMDTLFWNTVKRIPDLLRLESYKCLTSQGLSPIQTFEAVQKVDVSKCPRINLQTLIDLFCIAFPRLKTLKASYLLNYKARMLHCLLEKCPLLCEIDLTVDISPVLPEHLPVKVSTHQRLSHKSEKCNLSGYTCGTWPMEGTFFYKSGSESVLSNVTKLTLEGRTDVCDSYLEYFSRFCVSLKYMNLKGCISVTDSGIANFVSRCRRLQSIIVCDTSFGIISLGALCSGVSSCYDFAAEQYRKKDMDPIAFNLQTLHMGGCRGADESSILKFMSQTQMLKSLCLRGTHIVDSVLYSFTGSSLEMLDVSNTMVSGTALSYIISRNLDLRIVKASSCRNLCQMQNNPSEGKFPSEGLYNELGKIFKLEEIALGWGFSSLSFEAIRPAIKSLRKINVGLGGSLGEDALTLLPIACSSLESINLYFQIISDSIVINIMMSLKNLQELALCYCLGDISIPSFKFNKPTLKKLKLERVTPWMTNDHLVVLTQNCENLTELSLIGCALLNSESQKIISCGWPGLISLHLEECGQVTAEGVSSLLNCIALEDLLLRHNGPGIQKTFILDTALKLPMLRKVSLDLCDASEDYYDLPEHSNRCYLSSVTIARCKARRETLRTPVHKDTLALVWNSEKLTTTTTVKERL